MTSDAQRSLFRLLSNIASGAHPAACSDSPPSPSQHFAHTQRPDPISTTINDESVKQGSPTSKSSAPLRESVSDRMFEALPERERRELGNEARQAWLEQKESYNRDIAELYGEYNADELVRAMPDIFQPIMSALEAMTGLKFNLWAGGPINNGAGLININRNSSKGLAYSTFPEGKRESFRRAVCEWMQKTDTSFVDDCVDIAAVKANRISSELLGLSAESTVGGHNSILGAPRLIPKPPDVIVSQEHPGSVTPAHNSVVNTTIFNNHHQPTPRNEAIDRPATPSPHPPSDELKTPLMKRNFDNVSPLHLYTPRRVRFKSAPCLPASPLSLRRSPRSLKRINFQEDYSEPPTPPASQRPSSSLTSKSQKIPSLVPPHCPIKTLVKSIPTPYRTPIQSLIEHVPAYATWLPHALSSILQIDIGTNYYHLVVLLIGLEHLYGYSNSGGRLSYINRPAEVKRWILTGRSRTPIVIGDISEYAKNWWKWWKRLQPTWRICDDTSVLRSIAPPGQTEDWDCLLVPGANGLLSVVASLYWWGCAVCPFGKWDECNANAMDPLREWDEAVSECSWVVERLTLVMRRRKDSTGNEQVGNSVDDGNATDGNGTDENDIDELYEDD